MKFEWYRPDIGMEVEEASSATTEPLGHILGIR